MDPTPRTGSRGFTLVELLVVIAIIGLISAVALPLVLPALNERRVSESARLLQAVLAGARDAAIRANAPRGIRLLPDPLLLPSSASSPGVLAANRIINIEPAPNHTEGVVALSPGFLYQPNPMVPAIPQLRVVEMPKDPISGIPNNPTSWYWNIRQGDKIRFSGSGAIYTIAGPMTIGPVANPKAPKAYAGILNPERFINIGLPGTASPGGEYLVLVNGRDNNGNGFVDESFDGIDNDGDGIVDPSFNGLDDDGDGFVDNEKGDYKFGSSLPGEYEVETLDSTLAAQGATVSGLSYTIFRRPVVTQGARELALPAGVVVDLTTWNAPTASTLAGLGYTLQPERSRLPVDPYTNYVDIMIDQTGQVVQGGAGFASGDYNAAAPTSNQPFYHFWLTEREGVVPPLWGLAKPASVKNENDPLNYIPNVNPSNAATPPLNYLLPMPKGAANYPAAGPFLTGERRLVTLFVKTGQIVSNSIETFDGADTNVPYYDAQSGVKESQ